MSNLDTILASAIADVEHFVAFDLMAKARFAGVDLDELLVYVVDTVDASAIPYLADQFDVLGYKGMRLATTELQQREVIKRAIELHRYKGTVWAVKEALRNIGYPDARLIEHVTGWATFRIEIDAGTNAISGGQLDELSRMIEEYKNVRSHLIDISFLLKMDEVVILTDQSSEFPSVDDTDSVTAGGNFRHNGKSLRNGTQNYSSDSDLLTIQIITV